MTDTRIERDPLGEKAVPAAALYGIQTLRAAENFPISGLRPLPAFIDAVVSEADSGSPLAPSARVSAARNRFSR